MECGRGRHVSRHLAVTVDKAVIGGLDTGILIRHITDAGAVDELLALEDPPQ